MADLEMTRRVIYRGLKIDLALQKVGLRDGTTAEREVVLHRGAVALVPMVDPITSAWSRIDATRSAGRCWKCPPGRSTPGNRPTRPRSGNSWRRPATTPDGFDTSGIGMSSPGVMDERMYLYLCEDLRPGPAAHQLDEELQPVIVPWEEAMAMAEDGRIEDAKTLLALMICDRLRRRSSSSSGE